MQQLEHVERRLHRCIGTTYAVTKFFTKNGVLTFKLNTGATAATQGLTLVIDGEEFVLKEADQINGAQDSMEVE